MESVFSIITAIIAIISLIFAGIQIKMSNKQHLFDKRVNSYIKSKGILELYNLNKNLLSVDNRKDEAIVVDMQFICLTNNSFLKDITEIIEYPNNNDLHTKFLLKLEEIKEISEKVKFLFNGEKGIILSDFIFQYEELLLGLYKYQLIQNMMINNNFSKKDYAELQKIYGESSHREKLYKCYNNIEKSYKTLCETNTIKKIEQAIKLY